jgi:hypothetical protein
MVWIPTGIFAMGSSDDASQGPIHQVSIKPATLSKFPIMVREWNRCVAAIMPGLGDGRRRGSNNKRQLGPTPSSLSLGSLGQHTRAFGFQARPNGNMRLVGARERNIGGTIGSDMGWPIVGIVVVPLVTTS